MVGNTLHYVAWAYNHGLYSSAAGHLHRLLYAERFHPGVVSMIHRFMYSLNPDWGL